MDNFTNNTIIEGKSSKITFHRLSLLFKKELLENKKTLITELIVAWGSCILLGSLLGLFGIGGGYAEVLAFYTLLQYIAFIYASLAFSPMKHKKGRISTLMLPASSEEKFFVRWFLAVPILILFLVAGFYLGDIFRIIVAWLSESRTNDNYYRILNIADIFSYKHTFLTFLVISSYFFTQAIYFFGAILWPKLSFIKTFAAIYCVEMILGIALLLVFKFWFYDISFSESAIGNCCWSIGCIQIVLTLLLYWLSYYRFKTSSVIYHLF